MRAQSQLNGSKHILWTGVLVLVLSGVYNSIQLNSDSFMNQDWGVRFVKRLDELHGKVTVGRMAASTMQWTALEEKEKVKPQVQIKAAQVASSTQVRNSNIEKEEEVAEPAINEDLNLKLDQIFFKKPLDKGSFSGHARTVDGYIEEITVNLPDGKTIIIDARDRMVGNVFTYEDTETGELRSGMFYEVNKGKQYMITLTNDSVYAGLRLGFTTSDYSELRYDDNYSESNVEWAEKDFGTPAPEASAQAPNTNDENSEQAQEVSGDGEPSYSFDFSQS